ncbi:hypothetical protein ACPF4J_002533 [Vibrio cholerae]
MRSKLGASGKVSYEQGKLMKTVKCFKRDEWVDTNVFDMDNGDIFAH